MNDGNEQKKVKVFPFNKFHPDFDEFPIPEIDLSFNMGSGKKSKESEINLSFRMGVGKKANEPELSRAKSISIETLKQPRLGNVFPVVDGMMVASNRYGCESIRSILQVVSDTSERLIRAGEISIEPMAPHDDCVTSSEPMHPVTQPGNIYQADDGLLVLALDRKGELNPGSTACNVPVLFVDKFARTANLSTNKTGTVHAVDHGFSSPFLSKATTNSSST